MTEQPDGNEKDEKERVATSFDDTCVSSYDEGVSRNWKWSRGSQFDDSSSTPHFDL